MGLVLDGLVLEALLLSSEKEATIVADNDDKTISTIISSGDVACLHAMFNFFMARFSVLRVFCFVWFPLPLLYLFFVRLSTVTN